jgi:hypothetical protein
MLPGIVDAWDFDDAELISVLGKKSTTTDDNLEQFLSFYKQKK